MSEKVMTDVRTGFGRHEAAALQRVEYRRMIALLRSLPEAAWARRTDCPEWTVRDMVAHLLGGLEASASMREQAHQMIQARRVDRPLVDALGVVQIRDRAECSDAELVDRLEAAVARGVRGRERTPAPLRAVPMRFEMPYGTDQVRFGYLIDTILLRDVWMHRVDISRAADVPLVLTTDHDGRIVADVVREWSRRHGRPFRLDLEGPAGGRFTEGHDGEEIRLDAVEFCRIVAGRAEGPGLLTQEVMF